MEISAMGTHVADRQADLSVIVDRTARNLSGQERGQSVRETLRLDEFDQNEDRVVLRIPDWLTVLSPSFVQGLLAPSVRKLGSREVFYDRYKIEASDFMIRQIDAGVRRIIALSRH